MQVRQGQPRSRSTHGFLAHAAPIAFAHRGGAAEAPENSWAAFEHAVGLGYHHIETDVHASADGVAVLCHDADLRRVAGVDVAVPSTSWAAISAHPLADGRAAPRLDEALGTWPDVYWNLDLKHDAAVAPTVHAIERCRAHDRVLLGSFSDARTARARALLDGRVATSAGRREVTMFALAGRRCHGVAGTGPTWFERFLARTATDALQVPVRHGRLELVGPAFIALAHNAGKVVHVWTINEPQEMVRLLRLGVDGIMTDRPSVLRDVIEAGGRRGPWAVAEP